MKSIALQLIFLLIFSFQSRGQQSVPVAPAKKIHIDAFNRIYTQKSSPIFIRLSDSPDDNAKSYLMSNELTNNKAVPLFFDGHGKHHLVHNETHQTAEGISSYDVYVDGIAPVTLCNLKLAKRYFSGTATYFGKGLLCDLTAEDEMSGISQINFSIDGSPFMPYSKTVIKLNKEKSYNLRYYSNDNVGNMENLQSTNFTVDLTSPITNYEIIGTHFGNILAPSAKIKLISEDALSGINSTLFQLDQQDRKHYNNALSMESVPNGEHNFNYFSRDNVENEEPSKVFSFYLDNIAPDVRSDIEGDYFFRDKMYISLRTKIRLSAIDNKAGVDKVYYVINVGRENTYSSPFNVSDQKGLNVVQFYSIDKVKNLSETEVLSLYLDDNAPSTHISYLGPMYENRDTLFISASTKVSLSASDKGESGVQAITYTLNAGEAKKFFEPFSIANIGNQEINYSSIDMVNNVETLQKAKFFVDTEPPAIYPVLSTRSIGSKNSANGESFNIYPSQSICYLGATDLHSGVEKIYYSINNGPEILYTQPLKTFRSGETYVLKIRALDRLGNESTKVMGFAVMD